MVDRCIDDPHVSVIVEASKLLVRSTALLLGGGVVSLSCPSTAAVGTGGSGSSGTAVLCCYTVEEVVRQLQTRRPFENSPTMNGSFQRILQLVHMSTCAVGFGRAEVGFCVLFLSKLLLCSIFEPSIPVQVLVSGFCTALRVVTCSLSNDRCPAKISFQWSNREHMLSLIESHLRTSCCSIGWFNVRELAVDVLDIFVTTIRPSLARQSSDSSDDDHVVIPSALPDDDMSALVVYYPIGGPSVTRSELRYNQLLMDVPVSLECSRLLLLQSQQMLLHEGMIDTCLVVALFDCSLELDELNTNERVQLVDDNDVRVDDHHHSSLEHRVLDSFAHLLQRHRIDVVGCQRRVHPFLERRLSSLGIVCLQRLSVRFMGPLLRLTGARLLGSIPSMQTPPPPPHHPRHDPVPETLSRDWLDASSLGYLSSVRQESIHGHSYITAVGGYTGSDDHSMRASLRRRSAGRFDEASSLERYVEGAVLRHRPCVSVILAAPSDFLAQQLRSVYEECVLRMVRLMQDSLEGRGSSYACLLPGAGCWQVYAARILEHVLRCDPHLSFHSTAHKLSSQQASTRRAIDMFRRCLEDSAVLIAGGGGVGRVDSSSRRPLQRQSSFAVPVLGVTSCDPQDTAVFRSTSGDEVSCRLLTAARGGGTAGAHCSYQLVEGSALEEHRSQLKALAVATEVCCCVLQVDG